MSAAFLVTSAAAEDDIAGIARVISADSERAAERFGMEFDEALDRIRAFPQSGHAVSGFAGLRMMRVSARFWRYLIVYCLENSGVEIRRVLHGSMDIPAHLSRPR